MKPGSEWYLDRVGEDAETPENQIRGQSFRSTLHASGEVLGSAARERVLSSLPPQLREAFVYGAIVSGGWYPIDWYVELLRSVRAQAPGRPDIVRRIAYLSTHEDITAIYRFILRLTTPAFVLSHLGRVMDTFVRHSEYEIIERGPGLVRMSVSIPGSTPEMWEDFAGSASAVLMIAGGEDGRVAVRQKSSPASALVTIEWGEAE